MEEKDLLQSKFLFERSVKNNRCCYVRQWAFVRPQRKPIVVVCD